ncbi:hypothetical protein H4R34_003448, partial [Dimargaris verticillata]
DSDVFEASSRSPQVKVVSAPVMDAEGKHLSKKRTMNRSKSQPNIFGDFQHANRAATTGRDHKQPKASQRSPLGKSASATSPNAGKGTANKKPRGRNTKPASTKGSKANAAEPPVKQNPSFAPKQILKNPNRVHPSAKPEQPMATSAPRTKPAVTQTSHGAGKTQSTFRAFRSPVTETPLSMISSPLLLSEVEAHRV